MVESTTAAPSVDRAAIRAELQSTRDAFRDLVMRIGDDKWNAKSGNPGWSCGQLAWHLAEGVSFSVGLVRSAQKGKQTNPPSFLLPMMFKANEMIVRRRSRRATRDSVLADYADGLSRLLPLLDETTDADFARSYTNFGRSRSVREIFLTSVEHFAEHGPEIEAAL
jgi:hypothetical protein